MLLHIVVSMVHLGRSVTDLIPNIVSFNLCHHASSSYHFCRGYQPTPSRSSSWLLSVNYLLLIYTNGVASFWKFWQLKRRNGRNQGLKQKPFMSAINPQHVIGIAGALISFLLDCTWLNGQCLTRM